MKHPVECYEPVLSLKVEGLTAFLVLPSACSRKQEDDCDGS